MNSPRQSAAPEDLALRAQHKEISMISYDEFRAAMLRSDDPEDKERNKALVERYPFLLPRYEWSQEPLDDYDYEFTNLDDIPQGWVKSFGIQMCEEPEIS